MNRKFLVPLAVFAIFLLTRCGSDEQNENGTGTGNTAPTKPDTVVVSQGVNSKGIGRFTDVKLTHPLDEGMVSQAQPLFNSKCIACHKLTNEKLVGPGWKGITDRRTPEWIMNFITNTQVMLDKDLAAQSDLVTCVVRMPNQDLTDEQARGMLEFMRKNDGKN